MGAIVMRFIKSLVAVILIMMMTPGITFSQEQEQLLVGALKVTGAEPEMMDIVDWSVINREFLDFSQMKKCRDEILEIFDAKEKIFDETQENSERYRILNTVAKLDSETFLQIILQSVHLPEEYEKEPQTYLVVNVSGKNLDKVADCGRKAQEAVISLKGKSKITSCVTGSFNGKLDKAKQEQVLENIYDYLNISYTTKMQDEYTLNLMGYSPLLTEDIQILDKTYNINIAMRYNLEDDKTYIWIGTPVISLEH